MKRFLACILLVGLAACGGGDGGDGGSVTGATQITSQDVTVGTGATAVNGDVVTVNYVLTLTNGTVVDSSIARGAPFTFQIGAGAVIPGFEQGVLGMRVGGKRRISVPPSLGYGSQARQGIPANSTLLFEIDLLSIAGK